MELPVTCVDTSTLKRAVDPRCNDLCEMCLDRNGKILAKFEAYCIICEHRKASQHADNYDASRVRGTSRDARRWSVSHVCSR